MTALKTALITGASSGIGETFAHRLAGSGKDLVLVARSEDKLNSIAAQIREVYSRRVEVVVADLSKEGAAQGVSEACGSLGMQVDLLVNSAGYGTFGAFYKQEPARERQEVLLNAAGVVDMCHAFLPGMLERESGGIINVASLAGFQPLPFMAVYAATKAFVMSFSEGLRAEVKHKGIKVMALCPGPVDTPFFEATGVSNLRKTVPPFVMMTVGDVVAIALKDFKAGKGTCVPGVVAKLVSAYGRFGPRALSTAGASSMLRGR